MAGVELLIVGGSGLLGTALVEAASARGIGWAATHHSSERTGDRWHRVDLADADAISGLLDRLSPAAVINAAYVQRGELLEAVTAAAPGVIAGWTADRARFVHLSTDIVFDGRLGRPYREADPAEPVNDYGRAKLRSERAVADADPGAVVVRTSLLWGGSGDGGPQVRMATDPDVRFFTDEFRCPLDVASLADACLELVERTDITGPLHVAGPDRVDRLTFAQALAPLAGVDPTTLQGGTGADAPGRPPDVSLDTTRARALLRTPLRGLPSDPH